MGYTSIERPVYLDGGDVDGLVYEMNVLDHLLDIHESLVESIMVSDVGRSIGYVYGYLSVIIKSSMR